MGAKAQTLTNGSDINSGFSPFKDPSPISAVASPVGWSHAILEIVFQAYNNRSFKYSLKPFLIKVLCKVNNGKLSIIYNELS